MARKNISMTHPQLGKCSVEAIQVMSESCEFTVKGLMSMQLLVINSCVTQDPKLNQVIDILIQCSDDIQALYLSNEGQMNEPTDPNFFEHNFNKF